MRTINRDIVGIIIISSDNHLLLGKSRKGGAYQDLWIVPGGGVEDRETLLEAARREALEEVGIDIYDAEIIAPTYVHHGASEKILKETNEHVLVEMTFHDFLARFNKCSSEIMFNCEDDLIEAAWHSVDTLGQLQLSPPTKFTLTKLGYL